MNQKRIHPLDRLISDDSLFMLEAIIPFVDLPTKRLLAVFIKYKELTSILSSLSNPTYISECGFDCHPKSTDDMLEGICQFMPDDFRHTINQMKQMKGMMDIMDAMSDSKPGSTKTYDNCESETCEDSLFDSILSILNEN